MRRFSCIFAFLFEDTAPASIYTLSLHDALPISPAARPAPRPARTGRAAPPPRPPAGAPPAPPAPHGGRDRKSTRLNSSHVSISYAVFCLKKKKPCTPHFPTVLATSFSVTGYTPQ